MNTQYAQCNNLVVVSQSQLLSLYNRISGLEVLLEDMLIERKASVLRNMLVEYRRHHSLDASDSEYYALILLNAINSWAVSKQIHIKQGFAIDDAFMMNVLKRTTKNDNLTLRMLAFYVAYLSSSELEEFEVWNEPLDHYSFGHK